MKNIWQQLKLNGNFYWHFSLFKIIQIQMHAMVKKNFNASHTEYTDISQKYLISVYKT